MENMFSFPVVPSTANEFFYVGTRQRKLTLAKGVTLIKAISIESVRYGGSSQPFRNVRTNRTCD